MQTAVECFNVNLESVMVKGLKLHESWQSDLSIFNDHFSNTSTRSRYIIMPTKRGRCPWFFGQYRQFIKFIQLTYTCLLWSRKISNTRVIHANGHYFPECEPILWCESNNKIKERRRRRVMLYRRCHWGSFGRVKIKLPKKNQFRPSAKAGNENRAFSRKIISDWNSVEWSVVVFVANSKWKISL